MNLGILEIVFVAAVFLTSAVFYWRGHPLARWSFASTFCFLLAASVTPADPLTMVVVGVGMNACLALGAWLKPAASAR